MKIIDTLRKRADWFRRHGQLAAMSEIRLAIEEIEEGEAHQDRRALFVAHILGGMFAGTPVGMDWPGASSVVHAVKVADAALAELDGAALSPTETA